MIEHAKTTAAPPSQIESTVPADLEQVIMRCLEKNPLNRFGSALELEAALRNCSSSSDWNETKAAIWWQGNMQDHAL